ncbi:uncharacterized protein LOC128559552 [Mercenaria mercenaria]|uniref:uncharacterized protein LOC128559552 n=1 Tax=Mercenaria mercenaria TaxID=6596 RepID=UPI00234EE27C|nr:uncharacterized protein LOC128559552 [Mercenaria mercenaria]
MSVYVNMEEGTSTCNSGSQTADKSDDVDLDYCIRRVLNSGYTIDTARNTSDRTPVHSGFGFGTPTPDREFRSLYDCSPPTLYPYNARPSLETGLSQTQGRHYSFRPGCDTTPNYSLPRDRTSYRVSFGPERPSTASDTNPPVKQIGDFSQKNKSSDTPVGMRPPGNLPPMYSPSFTSSYAIPPQRLPKLPQFSGECKKEDVEFVVWKYEVNCLLKCGIYSEYCILESIRNSLKGKARSVLLHLGEWATVPEIMREMDATYGNVATPERLKEQFYSATQREGESIVDYSLRLEHLLCNSQIDLDRTMREDMLRNRLWSGLRDQELKNATRYKYESVQDYTRLRRELRQVEEDIKTGQVDRSVSSKSRITFGEKDSDVGKAKEPDARQCSTAFESKLLKQLQDLTTEMKGLNTRVSNIEKDLEEAKKNRNRPENSSRRWGNRRPVDRNQEKGTSSNDKPDSTSSASQEQPLNQQNPPPKGQ